MRVYKIWVREINTSPASTGNRTEMIHEVPVVCQNPALVHNGVLERFKQDNHGSYPSLIVVDSWHRSEEDLSILLTSLPMVKLLANGWPLFAMLAASGLTTWRSHSLSLGPMMVSKNHATGNGVVPFIESQPGFSWTLRAYNSAVISTAFGCWRKPLNLGQQGE